MSKSILMTPISIAVLILLIFLTLPCISSADQVEDIPDVEQQVQSAAEGVAKNSIGQSSSAWKRLMGFIGLDAGRPATPTEQEPMAKTPAIEPLAKQEPVVTPDKDAAKKAAMEKIAAEKAIQDRIAAEKAAQDKTATVKTEQVSPAETTPIIAQKSAGARSSTWQSFLALIGMHDDRQTIPPLEVKNSPSHLGQDYIIGPGDLLGISVWRDDSLTRSVVVLPDGKIQFPLIGEISAGGKSVAQLKQEFVEKLSSYVVDADISVEVKQSNSLFIYIMGRVNNPGRQMLVADTTVLQALAMAGGLNPFAEKDDIKIFRQDSDRTLVYSFRYTQVVSGAYLDDNLSLKRGDVIVVP